MSFRDKLPSFEESLRVHHHNHQTRMKHSMAMFKEPCVSEEDIPIDIYHPWIDPNQQVIERIVVPLGDGIKQIHYLTTEDDLEVAKRELDEFKQSIKRVSGFLKELPRRVAPSIKLPPQSNGEQERIVLWNLLLHRLDTVGKNPCYGSTRLYGVPVEKPVATQRCVEGSEIVELFTGLPKHPFYFKSWDDFSPVAGFDPLDLFTGSHKENEGWDYWQQRHQEEGREFPLLLACYLRESLLAASLNMPNLLRAAVEPQGTANRRMKKVAGMTDPEHLILAALMQHHNPAEGPCYDPMSGQKIIDATELPQSTVSKSLATLMDKIAPGENEFSGMKKYKYLCVTESICNLLEFYDAPKLREKALSEFQLKNQPDTRTSNDGSLEDPSYTTEP